MLNSFRENKARARTVVEKGEKSLLCDPGSELRLGGGGWSKRTKINEWDKKKQKKKEKKNKTEFPRAIANPWLVGLTENSDLTWKLAAPLAAAALATKDAVSALPPTDSVDGPA